MALLSASPSLAVLLAATLVLWYVVTKFRTYWALRHFSGPWTTGFSRLWLLNANIGGRMNYAFTEVNDKYGM